MRSSKRRRVRTWPQMRVTLSSAAWAWRLGSSLSGCPNCARRSAKALQEGTAGMSGCHGDPWGHGDTGQPHLKGGQQLAKAMARPGALSVGGTSLGASRNRSTFRWKLGTPPGHCGGTRGTGDAGDMGDMAPVPTSVSLCHPAYPLSPCVPTSLHSLSPSCVTSWCPHVAVAFPCVPPVQEGHQHAQQAVGHLPPELGGHLGGSVHVCPQQLWGHGHHGCGGTATTGPSGHCGVPTGHPGGQGQALRVAVLR